MSVWLRYSARPYTGPATVRLRHCLLYFVPGNPGLIGYYAPFLKTLRTLLDKVEDRLATDTTQGPLLRFHICGRNLLGFQDDDIGQDLRSGAPYGSPYGPGPFDLESQIQAAKDAVTAARVGDDDDIAVEIADKKTRQQPFDDIILVGHSIGSYIALEVLRRCQQDATQTQSRPCTVPRAGILLFATLTHLARSPRGQQLERLLATPLLGPRLPEAAQALLAWCVPTWIRALVVRRVLGFPEDAATTTLSWLASRDGVRQALHLGRHELMQVGPETWEEEVWEAAREAEGEGKDIVSTRPKFIILFGQNDHWVANDMRDHFIARRNAHEAGRVRIVVDDTGLPHAFCIGKSGRAIDGMPLVIEPDMTAHGGEVAEKVSAWVCEMML